MIPLRATTVIDTPEAVVHAALRRADVWTRTARALDLRLDIAASGRGPRDPLCNGDLLRLRPGRTRSPGWWPDRPLILRAVAEPGHPFPCLDLVAGPLRTCRISLTTAATAAGTSVTADVRVRVRPDALTPLLRSRILAAAQLLLGVLTLAARETAVVVAGAVIRDGALLAARRTAPAELAGQWELPGGKVDPGESEPEALARELREELGLIVEVGDRVGPDVDLGGSLLLRCFRARLVRGDPTASEHDQIRWVRADELDGLRWLPADRQLLPGLRTLLAG